MTLGEAIRYERKKRNLTLQTLAAKLGISTTYLGLIEVGKRGKNINVDLLLKLSTIFGVSTDYLLNRVPAEPTKAEASYEPLLTYYRLMDERTQLQLTKIAAVLIED